MTVWKPKPKRGRRVASTRLRHSFLLAASAIALLLALGTSALGCGSGGSSQTPTTPPATYAVENSEQGLDVDLPSFVTADSRQSYAYALAHPDDLRYIPCYCGCGLNAGHKNNLDCYISGVDKDGKVIFSDHAANCGICVEITQDVQRLRAAGKSLREIRAYVDSTHGPKGPGTDTPWPES